MAGFEVIVRPVVFPVIRPAPARPLAPQDDPEKGVAVIAGLGGKLIDLTFSESASWSRSKTTETERVVDRQRVYQKKPPTPEHPEGEIEKENYVDVETVKKMTERDGNGVQTDRWFIPPSPSDNVETLEKDVTIKNPDAADVEEGEAGP